MPEFTLFKFQHLHDEVNILCPENPFHHFDTLDDTDWESFNDLLTNFLVDNCLLCVIKESERSNCYSLPTQTVKENIPFQIIDFDALTFLVDSQPDLIFIPLIDDADNPINEDFVAHYTLCVLKCNTKEFIYINSLHGRDVGSRVYEYFVSKLNNGSLWSYEKIIERDLQKDSKSCGIFVQMYAEKILRNEPLKNLNTPKNFVNTLKSLLFKYQGDKTRFCCQCGRSKKNNEHNIVCQYCTYLVCSGCKPSHFFDNQFEKCKIDCLKIFQPK